jgi:glycosyltransferase involved in cell wall biosynthesis
VKEKLFSKMKKILYISYDGMTDQLGQSQVIPYLIGLADAGYQITIISFEKEKNYKKNQEKINALLSKNNIKWKPLSYTKNPPVISTVCDLWKMKSLALKLHRKNKFNIVHCRSYISALVGLSMARKFGTKFIFDMRGFWADERVEGGLWNLKNPVFSFIYKFFKRKELEFFKEADYIISLTEAGKKEIIKLVNCKEQLPIKVIPCCTDMDLFSRENIDENQIEKLKKQLSINQSDFIISYLGAIGTWYMMDEMLHFFSRLVIKKPNAIFLIITNEESETILNLAKKYQINPSAILIHEAARNEVPKYLSLCDLSIFFVKPTFSKIASSPTKLGEILAMGIPIICNAGIGDLETQIKGCGIVISKFNDETFDKLIKDIPQLLIIPQTAIRDQAAHFFSLKKGVNLYKELYSEI